MEKPRIIPQPKKFELSGGTLDLSGLSLVLAQSDVRIARAADVLRREIAALCGATPALRVGSLASGCVYISGGDDETKDGYTIDVAESGVTVGASGKRGAFAAIQTLRQLVMLCGTKIPLCRIEDEADYADRGFYHDVTRGRVPKLETLKALVDELALYK
jgi:N-acetyl-beta-hexosaminidase